MQILAIDTTARDACISGDLPTADKLLTQDIGADSSNYKSYVNHSFVKDALRENAPKEQVTDNAQQFDCEACF
ncbi:hypothetical protein BDR03DRAFT_1009023 [Suillus americanus]|nr:hypothetical protein BDR03DRAFT_1009023 [Suillus americanus]